MSAIAEIRGQRDAAVAAGVHPVFLVEDDYRIALLEAEAAFISAFTSKIEDPGSGWSGPWQAHHAGHGPAGAGTRADLAPRQEQTGGPPALGSVNTARPGAGTRQAGRARRSRNE
jgi:hypothetical protein